MKHQTFDDYMKTRFGGKVYRLTLSTGCTCPNRDGKCGRNGCIFCSAGGSGEQAAPAVLSVTLQIETAKEKVAAKRSRNFAGYAAYFQSFTNTYVHNEAELQSLRGKFLEAARHPEILAVFIGTRPDCLPPEILAVLQEVAAIRPVWVELGLQSSRNETGRRIGRGYDTVVYENAVHILHQSGIGVVTHMIVGLPGETERDMLQTARDIGSLALPGDGIKIQMLQVLHGTELARQVAEDGMVLPAYTPESYCRFVKELIRELPAEMVLHRLTGDPPRSLLISPAWTLDKKNVLNTMRRILAEE